jgi:hypothetical protein
MWKVRTQDEGTKVGKLKCNCNLKNSYRTGQNRFGQLAEVKPKRVMIVPTATLARF